jgi:DNA-binding CsgD family transcriptional regulator
MGKKKLLRLGKRNDPALSQREREVVRLLADGNSNKQVAAILTLSPRTVEAYRSRAMRKLNFHSFPELVRYAVRYEIVEMDSSQKSGAENEGRYAPRAGLADIQGVARGGVRTSKEFEDLQSRFKHIQIRFEKAKTAKARRALLASSQAIILMAHLLVAELREKAASARCVTR